MSEKTLKNFREDVIKGLEINYLFSYCPTCYCLPMIINSHRCEDGWNRYFISDLDYKDKVKICIKYMKQYKYKPILIENK